MVAVHRVAVQLGNSRLAVVASGGGQQDGGSGIVRRMHRWQAEQQERAECVEEIAAKTIAAM
jgi:hypothetical protein